MRVELVDRTVVIVAHDVNMSIFQPWWIIKNGILEESEIVFQGVLVTPVAVEVPTKHFKLTVLPNRIQMSLAQTCDSPYLQIERVLAKMIAILPHTPYSAVGFNFVFNILSDNVEQYKKWEQRLFTCNFKSLCELPEASNPRHGSYISYDVLDGRLKLNMLPITKTHEAVTPNERIVIQEEATQFTYNFHYDIDPQNNPVDIILGKLKKWNAAQDLAEIGTQSALKA